MNLLMITRKIDDHDERVGFVSDWIFEMAKNVNRLIIVCQEKGKLPEFPINVEIYSLGKERGKNKFSQIIKSQWLFLKLVKRVDGVFVHMIQHYTILVGLWCKLYNKKLIQWYVHKSVNFWLRLASIFIDEFITASVESFRMKTNKPIHVFGHGININKFKITNNQEGDKFTVLSVGRISPVKNYDTMLEVIQKIQLNNPELRGKILLQIIGGPGLKSQQSYYLDLIKTIKENNLNNVIDFIGPLPLSQVISYYNNCDLFINLSDTGSVDKVVLEAMASGKLVLTSNEAFKNILPEQFLCSKKPDELIDKIESFYKMSAEQKYELGQMLRQLVVDNHNLKILTKKIVGLY